MNYQLMQNQLQTVEFPVDWAKGKNISTCPVCDVNFGPASKLAIMLPTGGMVGWSCLKCNSRFDINNNLIQLHLPGMMFSGGEVV